MSIINEVVRINQELIQSGLVVLTWGNASAIEPDRKHIYIKPSGVSFKDLTPEKIVKVNLEGGFVGQYKPSVDTPTHLELYKGSNEIGAVIHTHSPYATAFAQAKMPIPILGTTHADYFKSDVPVIGNFTDNEINENYEVSIGQRIIAYFQEKKVNMLEIPAALIESHGVFAWGKNIQQAYENSYIVEQVARLAFKTLLLSKGESKPNSQLFIKHFERKHGKSKYYGQSNV
ncbi:MAG: L-ribulose-5-phosphate 4-epimerase AraD [Deltaproteobacteria bacterium]|nr:L-ribulose-5-phosphate 4-epimerase AraD [Deltaproteobacteria bacterium]